MRRTKRQFPEGVPNTSVTYATYARIITTPPRKETETNGPGIDIRGINFTQKETKIKNP